ncbi:2-C-methyl-D-erythritol 4-phosphate cytidylyltransferase [Microbacterium lushaniae]|uniref:Bifunctional enzyme IspD/IspF n=1 Tax=Microbacterium lushaniae TaxID=2614639 RepID=A0A5J6L658_9MICO|nr:2-C-methyl-D-erythritol 4-phosphate cytidylyltransferase [Microbacterium lushaniae]QEW03842.1 2-C-methyl-D-erythritol 2,4-cyclodiphosphate synthase [Microbacterium lushaniae]
MSITPVPRIAILVVAAGSGTRLGANSPKAFVGIDRHTVLRHALDGVFAAPSAQVIVVAPAGREGDALTEVLAASGDRRDLASVVVGGATRQESVAAGLAAVWPDVEFVLVHDAARALTPPDVFVRVLDALADGVPAVVPALPVVDTLKQVQGSDVVAAVDRSQLAAAQTPQGFARVVIDSAYAVADREYTDDAALVAAAGTSVAIVPGDTRAFKITTPDDLERARALVAPSGLTRAALEHHDAVPRVGIGTDVHAFSSAGTLWLAGLEWPGEPALSGHSDGDVIAHAIVDAVLSAAGLGDIGTHFGTDRPEYSGAHAEAFLARTVALAGEAGWRIGNVAVQVQAARPRFSGRRAEAEAVLSAALGGAPVSVSATTTDGLGFTGRGEGVAAFATALVVPA